MLNKPKTHAKTAFDAAFVPERARKRVRRKEFCYTAKHGSWPKVAKRELSVMTRQSLSGCRIGALIELRTQVAP